VTVRVAALFDWNYAESGQPPDIGMGALTVSDETITAGDIQFGPKQQKLAWITDKVHLEAPGDYGLHPEAVKYVQEQALKNPTMRPFDVAVAYGSQIQAIQRRHPEAIYLAPLEHNTKTFVGQEKEMSERYVDTRTSQSQTHHDANVQAIVVGIENDRAHLYAVDHGGCVRSFHDAGFVTIPLSARSSSTPRRPTRLFLLKSNSAK